MYSQKETPALGDILGYQNDRLLQKFRTLFDISVDDSGELFVEMKKWLWICMKRKTDRINGLIPKGTPPLVIHSGLVIIDEL